MTSEAETLHAIINPAIALLGYELVGCELHRSGGRSLLRVYIDSDKGVTLEDCERASRQISAVLDVEDPISGAYDLEVSSPGLNRPLFVLEHYQRFIGKPAKIRLRMPQQDRRNFTGKIAGVNDGIITLIGENGEVWELPFPNIEKGNLIPGD